MTFKSTRSASGPFSRLLAEGFIVRHYFPEVPPHVEHELTEIGHGAFRSLEGFNFWVYEIWTSSRHTGALTICGVMNPEIPNLAKAKMGFVATPHDQFLHDSRITCVSYDMSDNHRAVDID
jgi:hypothetical protein